MVNVHVTPGAQQLRLFKVDDFHRVSYLLTSHLPAIILPAVTLLPVTTYCYKIWCITSSANKLLVRYIRLHLFIMTRSILVDSEYYNSTTD